MDKSVMEDTRTTPICSRVHDNASHILLGRVYWQGRKAVWAGRKHFTLDIRSGGTEQPVCDCVWTHLWVCVFVSMCEQQSVSCCARAWLCGTCVGVCVCVGEKHSYPSKSPVGRPLPREKNEPCPTHSACCCYSPATISFWFTLSDCEWGRHTSLAISTIHSQHHHRKLTHKNARIPCMLIQMAWINICEADHSGSVSLSDRCEGGHSHTHAYTQKYSRQRICVWGACSVNIPFVWRKALKNFKSYISVFQKLWLFDHLTIMPHI